MTQLQLNINIDQQGIQMIYNANQYVTIVQAVPGGGGSTQVAWLVFQPYQTNQVSWIDSYSLYATMTSLQPGATIMMFSMTSGPVQFGWIYALQQGQFSGAPGGSPGAVNAQNQMQNGINFGLAQSAVVNGTNVFAPTCAVSVPMNQTVSFTPTSTVSIFLSSYSNNGTVISQVPGNALTVPLSSQNPVATLGFNAQNGSFVLQG